MLDSGVTDFENHISDHRGTYIEISVNINTKLAYKRNVFCYEKGDYENLNLLIKNTDWTELFGKCDVDNACSNFYTTFMKYVNMCIPSKFVTIRPKDKPWFDSNLRRQFRIRDRLRKKAIKSKKENDILAFKQQRNKVNNMKYYAKEKFYFLVSP